MAGATFLRATRLGPLLTALLVILSGSTSGETLSGKIRSIDRIARTVNVQALGSGADRTLRIDRESVVAGLPGSQEWAGLGVGQLVRVTLEAETATIKKLQVVVSPTATGAALTTAPVIQEVATRADANRLYGLTTATVRSIEAVLSYEMMVPGVRATEWVVVAAQAPELPGQMNARSSMDPGGHPTWDLSPGHRPLLVSRIAANAHENTNRITARVQYHSTLMSRHLDRRQAGDQGTETDAIPLGAEERRRALAKGGTYESDAPEFRRWMSAESLAMQPQESEIDYARRVFLVIKRSFTYEYHETLDRRLSRVCAARRSDCGGLSILFAAALRTQGIPARILVGRWAKSAEPGAQLGGSAYHQWHVKAEFYADGVGWIPADPAAGLVYDQSAEGLRNFGHDEGDFLTLHVDPDLVLDTVHFGPQPTPFLNGGLGVWVVGSGSLVNPRVRQDWQVREVGAPSRLNRLAESMRSTPTPR
ncbi:Transglutaminase-like superfamily protein [Singulisphaera sp. GP187]|uniref:transglutaminase-like domain-containing protein n=1 Tax=Singulisphaera sp. GP187 TaxID=1882752 RepID=UPI00092B75CD|nr:transglutaminase-like domain-containing protein [Singulisphaera sp. GP187]SIN96193.1 Transglutaminase-like superfamily protein [Singulisphaera sp. GP187]